MMDTQSLFLPALVFLMTVAFGFLVSKFGKPYHTILFNVHKLAALAGVVMLGLRVRSNFLVADFSRWMILVLGSATLTVIMLFGTGAVMSIKGEGTGLTLFFHRAGPVIITLCLVGIILVL